MGGDINIPNLEQNPIDITLLIFFLILKIYLFIFDNS